jgi:hypothetical protein
VLIALDAEHSSVVIPLMAIVGFGLPTLLILLRRRIEWLFAFPLPRSSNARAQVART